MPEPETKPPSTQEYLVNLVKSIYAQGFISVVLTDKNKQPIAEHRHWKEPLPLEEALKLLRKYSRGEVGVAIYPGHYRGEEHVRVVIFDVDDVKRADPLLTKYFGNWRVTLCGQPDSFCGLSGPRCPYDGKKHDIVCTPHAVLKGDYRCTHVGADHPEFNLSEAPRGMYIVVRIPEDAVPQGTIRKGNNWGIEILVDNYQVIAGRHPSDVQYEPIRYVNGKPTPLDSFARGVFINDVEKLKAFFTEVQGEPEVEAKPGPQVEARVKGPVKELSDEQIDELINHIQEYYTPGNRNNVLFSVLSFMVTHNISYESARRFVEKLTEVTNDEEARQRLYLVDWAYKKATERPPDAPPHVWNKNKIIDVMTDVIEGTGLVEHDVAHAMAKEWFRKLYKIMGVGTGVSNFIKYGAIYPGQSKLHVFYDPEGKMWYYGKKDKRSKKWQINELYKGEVEFYVVKDPIFNKLVRVFKTPEDTWFSTSIKDLVDQVLTDNEAVRANDHIFYLWVRHMLLLARERGIVRGHVVGGFYPDGFYNGLKQYPVKRHGCSPKSLEEVVKWVKDHYPPANRQVALANIGLALGKLISPAVRFARGVFEDRVVINVGRMRLGKTKLFLSIINLFGLDRDDRSIYVTSDVSVKTPERIRNLLMETNAPAFIDEMAIEGFEALNDLLLASATSSGVIGLQANKVGMGFAGEFRSLRSVMINTNMTVGEIKRVLSQGGRNQGAWVRRVIILQWSPEPLHEGVDEWSGEPLIDCIIELWNDPEVRNELIHNSRDIIELSINLLRKFSERYKVDVSEVVEALQHVKELVKELEDEVINKQRPEELVINRAYEITRQVIGASNITPYHVVKAMAENPTMFDIRITSGKDSSADEDEWRELVEELGLQFTNPGNYKPGTSDFNILSDVEKALAYVWWLITTGRNRVIIYANSQDGLLQGSPTVLFGSQRSTYSGGRRGFSVSWVTLLRYLFNLEEKNKGEHGENGKP